MKIINFNSDPRFPPLLLYVRWKAGVTFVRRYFRDVKNTPLITDCSNAVLLLCFSVSLGVVGLCAVLQITVEVAE